MGHQSPPLAPDTIIADRYRVVERLGEGGMGVVYSVEHMLMRKLFALKVLHRELLVLPEVVARFEREAVLAGSIDHPNVAAATDFGKLPDGSFFLILELVTGASLRDVIAKGPLEIVRAHGIMRGITTGIAAAHAKGIVHRDLKPENVMLVDRDGHPDFVKVLDFGIAKGAAAEAPPGTPGADQPLTQLGTLMGTPQYMSPEQALGQAVDHRSDLYALGVIFHEMVVGVPPFEGEALQVLRGHVATEPKPIAPELVAGVTVPVDAIIARLLAKDPDARYQTAIELSAALEGQTARSPEPDARAVTAIAMAPSSSTTPATVGMSKRTRMTVGLGALVVLGATLVMVMLTRRDVAPAGEVAPATVAAAVADSSRLPAEPAPTEPALTPAPAVSEERLPIAPVASATAEPSEVESDPTPLARATTTNTNGKKKALSGRPVTRHTGPGGIYIPPPNTWFK